MSRISTHTLPSRQFQYVETPTQRIERIAFVNRREWARRVSVWAKSIDGEYVDSGVGLLPEPPVSTCITSGRSRLLVCSCPRKSPIDSLIWHSLQTPPPLSRTRPSPSPSHIPPQLQYTSDSDSGSSSGSECDCDRNCSCCDCGCCGDVDYDDGAFEYSSRTNSKTSTVQVIPVPTSRSPIGSSPTPKIYSRDYYYDSHSPSKSVSFEDTTDHKSLANDYTYSDGGEPYLIYSSSPSSSSPSSSSTSPSSSRSTSPATSTKRSYSSFKSNTPPAFPVSILKSSSNNSTKPRSNSSPPIYYSSTSQPISSTMKPRSNSSPPAFSTSDPTQTFQYTYSNSTNYAIPSSTWSKSHRRHRSSLCSIPEIPDVAEGLEGLEDYI